jgi:signal transduction histidine kinase/CheY-like chemotaxis protein
MKEYLEQEMLQETRRIVAVINDKMAVPLFFLFWLLDILYVPQLKWQFLALRCLILPTALITHWRLKRAKTYRQAEQAGLFLIFMCSLLINIMTYIIGKESLYVVPLQLVAIGGLSFVPWSRGYFVSALLSVYVPYYAIELSRIETKEDINLLLVNSFFIVGIISITWVIHVYREKLRQRELGMRGELEREVEQRKQTEQALIEARDQALAAKQAKEVFLANMSHEIRTPLTAIIGFAEHALDHDLSNTERMVALSTIASSGNHLLSIINDILDFSKIEANSIELEHIAMDPIEVAAEVQSLVMPLTNKKGLHIKLVYDFPLPASIISDPVRIKQVLINLCSNAIKFTEHGAITITLSYDRENNLMIYRIKDSGIGMSEEQVKRIFDPFKQADSSITRRYGGTGLGLSLSRRLAQLLGGELTVNSQKDIGSEFELKIAAGDCQAAGLIQGLDQLGVRVRNEVDVAPVMKLQGHVLLVEDNENNQRLLSLYLDKMGLEVTHAENGAVAVMLARNRQFDLVLMDMQMPVLSGVDAVRQLRADNYPQPIIALTANATQQDRRQCLDAGCNDFLTKPVTRERLYEKLVQYLAPAPAVTTEPEPQLEPLHSILSEQEPEFTEIVNQFIGKLPDMITTIDAAFWANDWEKFRETVHNLKGMGGGFGFPQLTEHAAEIEKLHNQQDYAAIQPQLAELQQLSQRIQAGIQQISSVHERNVG